MRTRNFHFYWDVIFVGIVLMSMVYLFPIRSIIKAHIFWEKHPKTEVPAGASVFILAKFYFFI